MHDCVHTTNSFRIVGECKADAECIMGAMAGDLAAGLQCPFSTLCHGITCAARAAAQKIYTEHALDFRVGRQAHCIGPGNRQ